MTDYVRKIVENLKDKKCFFDFDGTLCECRFMKAMGEGCSFVNKDCNFLELCIIEDPYKDARPVGIMKEVLENLNPENIYVLGRTNGTPENIHKINFLHKYFPMIKDENMIFVNSAEAKCVYINQLRWLCGTNDLILIEDDYNTILMAENNYSINCYHVSSFMS